MFAISDYRPKSLDDIILPKHVRDIFNGYIKIKEIPNLFFYGPAGTGKTSTALVLSQLICPHPSDRLLINASIDRGIENIRSKIVTFAKVKSYSSKIKIIIMDEADSLTVDAMHSLRNIIDGVSTAFQFSRFIFTANYESNIIPEIKSRLTPIPFKVPPIKHIKRFIDVILNKHNISHTLEDVNLIVSNFYPDIRSMLNFVLSYSLLENRISISQALEASPKYQLESILKKYLLSLKLNDTMSEESLIDRIDELLDEYEEYIVSALESLIFSNIFDDYILVIMYRYFYTIQSAVSKSLHLRAMLAEIRIAYKKHSLITS